MRGLHTRATTRRPVTRRSVCWVSSVSVLILSVLDAWLPTVHKGYWGLIAGVVVAVGAFQTARTRQCPINGLLGVNTAQGAA